MVEERVLDNPLFLAGKIFITVTVLWSMRRAISLVGRVAKMGA